MIEKIVLALVATMIGSLILYSFRVRQLYITLPRLFSVSALTSTGKLAELRVFNRSRSVEEEIVISLSPDRVYEIVGSTDASPVIERNSIRIPRIAPGDDFSVLMMVEKGGFTKDEISTISSKAAKGKFIDSPNDIPPNAGTLVVILFSMLLMVSIPVVCIEYYSEWKSREKQADIDARMSSLSYLKEEGWVDLEVYSESGLRKSYSQGEFPVFQKDIKRYGSSIHVTFRFVNKTAALMGVKIIPSGPYESADPRPWEHTIYEAVEVEPISAEDFIVKLYWPKGEAGQANVKFSLDVGGESYVSLNKLIKIDKNQVL